ncbi:DctP family TRAP transporter solute-binding subunit [Rhizobium sp. RU36D]|uniref:DctP family TRAP transporter solute-binding subunit n=1 Tax=Rhizobium sp. RU36D TaxID=1907415 RepID=UPI0009D7D490|nr:DctP family TRAP transporter solute-binding subunit [Rhizobium sp. RU36D]SMD12680.1 tripartite ATP-independent transporter solute receptor, DctP family [Rhizobium sp. RU36D]
MNFKTSIVALIVASATVAATSAAMAADKRIRLSTAAPASDYLSKACETFKTELEKAGVDITVEVYPASSLFRQGTEVPALQRGNLEMSTMTTFEIAQQIPSFGFLNRAFLFSSYDQMMGVMGGEVGEALKKAVSEDMDIEILSTAYLGTRQLNLREDRPASKPEDLAGVKMRMPSSPEWLLLGESLGVTPTPLAMPEVYVALQTGAIDGQENPLTITNAAKFYEVTKQIVLTAHLVQPVFFSIGKPFWSELTLEQQAAVSAAAKVAADQNNTGRSTDEGKVLAEMESKGLKINKVDLTPFKAKADAVYGASDLAKAWDADLMAKAMAK